MIIDKKIAFIVIEAVVIVILIILLIPVKPSTPIVDPYLQQLKQQNLELTQQMNRLKQNYVEIGLVDSIQTRNMDSLITVSNRKVNSLRDEAKTYRTALEEMKTREWKKLNDTQKTKEIEEALNFLQSNEKQK